MSLGQVGGGIVVLAGTNGAGKSSVLGRGIIEHGGLFVNPDDLAKSLISEHPGMDPAQANSDAWQLMVDDLDDAIEHDTVYSFETTLGGNTIPRKLREAVDRGRQVQIIYVGLNSVDLHISRVALRVSKGGHPIPEQDIRRRYDHSRENMVSLIGVVAEAWVFDNSNVVDDEDVLPVPHLLIHTQPDEPAYMCNPMPNWAQMIADAVT